MSDIPILYSFRRCPYAMRARMGLLVSGQTVELREVVLRDKPDAMIAASPKATVPVMIMPNGQVIDQSIDILCWALQQNDPQNWLADNNQAAAIIAQADGPFKTALDRYKYHTRYDDAHPDIERAKALAILSEWDDIIAGKGYFFSSSGIADHATFPFVRQFANHDRLWFDTQPIPHIHAWLHAHLNSPIFADIMHKYPPWQDGDNKVLFAV